MVALPIHTTYMLIYPANDYDKPGLLVNNHNLNRRTFDEPSYDKVFDTHADDYNFATWRKLQNRSFGELPRKRRTGQASDLFNQIINR
ncbi:MAG: hypothetical protein ACOCYO_00145 [Bacteroidota bacterium]